MTRSPGGGALEPIGRAAGGLDRATVVVAGVATIGLIMAVLDTRIVNVALDALARDLHAPLSTIQWVSTGYLLSLATVIPLSGWVTAPLRRRPGPGGRRVPPRAGSAPWARRRSQAA